MELVPAQQRVHLLDFSGCKEFPADFGRGHDLLLYPRFESVARGNFGPVRVQIDNRPLPLQGLGDFSDVLRSKFKKIIIPELFNSDQGLFSPDAIQRI